MEMKLVTSKQLVGSILLGCLLLQAPVAVAGKLADFGSTGAPTPTLPSPEHPKSFAVPPDHRLRLDDDQ